MSQKTDNLTSADDLPSTGNPTSTDDLDSDLFKLDMSAEEIAAIKSDPKYAEFKKIFKLEMIDTMKELKSKFDASKKPGQEQQKETSFFDWVLNLGKNN